jgi:hypothetical protein
MSSRLFFVLVALAASSCKKDEPETTPIGTEPSSDLAIDVTDPPAGAHVPVGPLTVAGTQSGLSDVTVNGDAVEAADGSFSVELAAVRGVNAFEARGEKGTTFRMVRRSVLAGSFAPAEGPIAEAIGIRLNQGGLDAVGGLVGGLLDPASLTKSLAAANPVYESFVADVYVQNLDFAPMTIDFTPSAGELAMEIRLPDIAALLLIDTLGDVELTATASQALITGVVTLGTDGQGHLTAGLTDVTVELLGFDFDTSLLPGDLTFFLDGTLQGIVEGVLLDQLEAAVPALLEEQLSSLDLAFELDLLGTPVTIGADFRGAGIDADGVQLVADLEVDVPALAEKTAPGFLKAEADRPEPNRSADLSMALSDDLVNRLLFEVWRGGLVDQVLSTEDGSLPSSYLESFGTDTGTLTLDAKLPPVLVQTGAVTELQIGELQMRLDTPTNSEFSYIDLAMSAKIPVDLEVVGGNLTVALGEPDVDFIVRDTDWGVDRAWLTTLLEEELPVAALIGAFGAISIELPTLGGIALDEARIDRDASGVFTNIAAEL